MYWLEVSIVTGEQVAEGVAAAVEPFAYQETVVLEQLGDPHDLNPNAMLPYVTVKFYVAETDDTPALRQAIIDKVAAIQADFPAEFPTFRPLQEEDWANAWKVHYKPFRLGQRFWIQPSWEPAVEAEPTDIVLTLDPGMAFGTGLHATTQLCLALLEEWVEPGDRVLDVGTGSGILAIAAAKLCASQVVAIDNDPLAVAATQGNLAMNGVENQIHVWQGELTSVPVEPYNVVVVNILAPIIILLLREGGLMQYVAPHGHLILSGLINVQKEEVEAAVAAAGGIIRSVRQDGDWLALHVSRKTYKDRAEFLIKYFEWVNREYPQNQWQTGTEIARQWLKLLNTDTKLSVEEVTAFIDTVDQNKDRGSGWFDLALGVGSWARANEFPLPYMYWPVGIAEQN